MSKAEALELCLDSLLSRPPVVALLETHHFLAAYSPPWVFGSSGGAEHQLVAGLRDQCHDRVVLGGCGASG